MAAPNQPPTGAGLLTQLQQMTNNAGPILQQFNELRADVSLLKDQMQQLQMLMQGVMESQSQLHQDMQQVRYAAANTFQSDKPDQKANVPVDTPQELQQLATELKAKELKRSRRPEAQVLARFAAMNPLFKQLLAKSKVDVNSKSPMSTHKPLQTAARWEIPSLVKLLVQQPNIDVNVKNTDGRTPLSLAAEQGSMDAIEALLSSSDVHVNAKDKRGRAPLSYAAQSGNSEAVSALLSRSSVDLLAKDNQGRSALFYARGPTAGLLLGSERINVRDRDRDDRTALSWAASAGEEDSVRTLLAADPLGVEDRDLAGLTALSWAARHGHERVVQALLEIGHANVDATALFWTAKEGRRNIARVLMLSGRGHIAEIENVQARRTFEIWAKGVTADSDAEKMLAAQPRSVL